MVRNWPLQYKERPGAPTSSFFMLAGNETSLMRGNLSDPECLGKGGVSDGDDHLQNWCSLQIYLCSRF